MSGGVDSSAAAALLVERGYEVIGATLRLYDASGTDASIGGRCCGPRDIEDARATAALLGIPHHVIDESAAFQRAVIDDFVAGYRAGARRTRACAATRSSSSGRCWRSPTRSARRRWRPALRAPRPRPDGGVALGRARDRGKDQSYFLFGVRPELLSRVWFPLGDMSKDDVRALARRGRPAQRRQADSQQICFIPDGDHVGFLARTAAPGAAATSSTTRRARASAPRRARTRSRSASAAASRAARGAPRFVLRIDAATGEVRVGPRDRLGRDQLRVGDVRWLDRAAGGRRALRRPDPPPRARRARLDRARADGGALVRLDEPAYGVAPGQAAVFYDGDDRVIGGGWIQ
jgi:tRNA-specific 2-thiouridylase